MRWLRSVFSISAQNLRKWQTDYRVWCIGIMLFAVIAVYVDDMRSCVRDHGEKESAE